MITLTINGETREFDVDPSTPLLWVIREQANLTGTKFGCGIAQCGACTVHVDGRATRSCVLPISAVKGRKVETIEGKTASGALDLVREAWLAEEVSQCGYCQPGFLMAAAALLVDNPDPTDAEIDATLTNICRCGTYPRIRKAIHRAAAMRRAAG